METLQFQPLRWTVVNGCGLITFLFLHKIFSEYRNVSHFRTEQGDTPESKKP